VKSQFRCKNYIKMVDLFSLFVIKHPINAINYVPVLSAKISLHYYMLNNALYDTCSQFFPFRYICIFVLFSLIILNHIAAYSYIWSVLYPHIHLSYSRTDDIIFFFGNSSFPIDYISDNWIIVNRYAYDRKYGFAFHFNSVYISKIFSYYILLIRLSDSLFNLSYSYVVLYFDILYQMVDFKIARLHDLSCNRQPYRSTSIKISWRYQKVTLKYEQFSNCIFHFEIDYPCFLRIYEHTRLREKKILLNNIIYNIITIITLN